MIYEYECPVCFDILEEIKSVKERDNAPSCKVCDVLTKRIMSAGIFKIEGYSEANGYSTTK
ncbi:MAG: hypothetical protein KAS32_03175 [Candidatus Peribacteraceae bacterium]|nr:hypothetical protein [Candidatus Peribacteraceae bacterium]